MKVSEIIRQLQYIKDEHGDVKCIIRQQKIKGDGSLEHPDELGIICASFYRELDSEYAAINITSD